jgi:hypothetical protein
MLALIRFVIAFFFLSMVARFFLALFGALLRPPTRPAAPTGPRQAPSIGTPLVRDRICDTFVPQDRALRASIDGHEEFFCSEACRTKALAPGHPPDTTR